LHDATSYLVTITDDGPDHDCVVDNGSGTIAAADVPNLHVSCTNLIPHGIALSIPTGFVFDPRTTRYTIPVTLLQQELTVTVTGPTLTGADVNGTAVVVGQVSVPVAIGQAQTTVPVVVRKGRYRNGTIWSSSAERPPSSRRRTPVQATLDYWMALAREPQPTATTLPSARPARTARRRPPTTTTAT
jgi:hypothetical protein